MDREVFEELFSGVSRGRSRFDLMADELDVILPAGWSERTFPTSTKCVVSRKQPISIRFAKHRRLHYDHSECLRCQWSGDGEKPALCEPRKTLFLEPTYLSVTFSRERSHLEQATEGTTYIISFITSLRFFTL